MEKAEEVKKAYRCCAAGAIPEDAAAATDDDDDDEGSGGVHNLQHLGATIARVASQICTVMLHTQMLHKMLGGIRATFYNSQAWLAHVEISAIRGAPNINSVNFVHMPDGNPD